jgi:hypothetical protein
VSLTLHRLSPSGQLGWRAFEQALRFDGGLFAVDPAPVGKSKHGKLIAARAIVLDRDRGSNAPNWS